MRRLCCICLPLLWAAALCPVITGHAADLPPGLGGELTGKLAVRALKGAPPLAWRVSLEPTGTGEPLRMSVTAPGLNLEAVAALPQGGAAGTWRVVRGSVELAEWLRPILQANAASLPDDLALTGTVVLSGAGTWQGSDLRGSLQARLLDGEAQSAAQGWSARGLALQATVALDPVQVAVLQSAQLTLAQVEALGLKAEDFRLELAGVDGNRLEVRRADFSALGGRVALMPFIFDPANPAVRTTADLIGVALDQLAHLLPDALAEASGRVSGRIAVNWSFAEGARPGTGSLTMSDASQATLRLAAAPGFLTQHMPARIALLPAWLGPLAKWFSPENPAYDTLRRIELGELPLTVDRLRMELYPDGPDGPRSAVVEISARPAAGSIVEQVSFTVNVAGPLREVLELGLNDRASLDFGMK
jgi:hypothetical protein